MSLSLASPREERAGERRALLVGLPLSLTLSPLLRRGAREFTARCRLSHWHLSIRVAWIPFLPKPNETHCVKISVVHRPDQTGVGIVANTL